MSQLHDYFGPIIRKQRKINKIFAVILLLVCIIVAIWFLSTDTSKNPSARMGVLSFIILPIPLIVLVSSIGSHKGLAALADPSRVVWYFGRMKGGHVNAVMIGFDDGKLYRFQLPLISIKKGFSQEAFRLLKEAAPRATTGYSEELRKAFKSNPASLKA